jgi:hypothetical protein
MQTLTSYFDTFLQLLNNVLNTLLNWGITLIQTIGALIYLLVVSLITIVVAVYHWLIMSLEWFCSTTANLFDWIITSLKIAEHSLFYGFGAIVVILLAMSILILGLSSRTRKLESQNRVLYEQNANLHSRHREITNKIAEDEKVRKVQGIVNGVVKVGQYFLNND